MSQQGRNQAFDEARKGYRGALLTICGDKDPDVAELIDKHGIGFALRVLRARRLANEAHILRKKV